MSDLRTAFVSSFVENMNPMNSVINQMMAVNLKDQDLKYDRDAEDFCTILENKLAKAKAENAPEAVIDRLEKKLNKYS